MYKKIKLENLSLEVETPTKSQKAGESENRKVCSNNEYQNG